MSIDVTAQTTINRPRQEVADFATNPHNDPVWIGGISQARLLSEPPVAVGTQVERVASFLGRRIEYVNEVVDYEPGARLAMRSVKGPFPMAITYSFDDGDGGTLTSIRVQGDASGFFRLASPLLALAVHRSITRDLRALKRLLESKTPAAP